MPANYTHYKALSEEKWDSFSLSIQMGNIGSDVSRALKWMDRDRERSMEFVERALELTDLTVMSLYRKGRFSSMRELCRSREVLCDFFYGDNEFLSTPENLMKYYDGFVIYYGGRGG